MSEIPVFWHHGFGNWDCALPSHILYKAGAKIYFDSLHDAYLIPCLTAVICIPGRHSTGDYDLINRAASHFDNVVFVIFGDEEGIFHADRLQHKNKKVWWFMPPFHPKQQVDRVAINGWPIDAMNFIERQNEIVQDVRDFDWSFLGQVTHSRRIACVDATQGIPRGFCLPTDGFAQGIPRENYYRTLCRSKIALCPSGPCTPDSFRIAEALLAGCIPIADDLTQNPEYPNGYWNYAFATDKLPFPVISDWKNLPKVIEETLFDYQHVRLSCVRFFSGYLDFLIKTMEADILKPKVL